MANFVKKKKAKKCSKKSSFLPNNNDSSISHHKEPSLDPRSLIESTKDAVAPLKVYLPGMELAEGEVLEPDLSAYVMLHEMTAEWPCLSLDTLLMNGMDMGLDRNTFPMTAWIVAGTQADEREHNQLLVMKWSGLHQIKKCIEESEEDESEGDDEDDDGEACYQVAIIPHSTGAINRIKAVKPKQATDLYKSSITATWSDEGKVLIWNLDDAYNNIQSISTGRSTSTILRNQRPMGSVTGHTVEGFALDWNPLDSSNQCRLLSGDCSGKIFFTTISNDAVVYTDPCAFNGHVPGNSVEDIQWSPSESTIFASASTDCSIRLWDIRMPRNKSALSIESAHQSDVNVISWNPLVTHLLASGSDEGAFKTWDLRSIGNSGSEMVEEYRWHQDAITSIEWNPVDPSVLAVAGSDDQITIWDFSIATTFAEPIPNTTCEMDNDSPPIETPNIPPQLLFIHQGQQHVKEVHWHPQLSGVLVSTSITGFNIFKTISV